MTPEHPTPTGPRDLALDPPPGCPAHTRGPGGLARLYGPGAEDLNELYERLREEHGPVAPVLIHDDLPMWMVLGHAENLRMVRTPSQFTKDSRIWSQLVQGRVRPDHPLMPHIAWQPICAHAEGDEHRRLRGAVTAAMATIDDRSVRRYINRSSQRLVNRFCEQGRAELVGDFAEHLPMAVMCHVLGMPDEYNDKMVHAARDALKGSETAVASHEYVVGALARLTARRRAEPEEDFTSHLITHPAALTDDEVREHLRLVLFAAYENTVNLLSNVLRMVLTDPRFLARLNGGQMTVAEAVEQSLWDEPPSAPSSATSPSRTRSWAASASAAATASSSRPRRATWTPGCAPTCPPTCRATAPTSPSAAVRTSAPARTSDGRSPTSASTRC